MAYFQNIKKIEEQNRQTRQAIVGLGKRVGLKLAQEVSDTVPGMAVAGAAVTGTAQYLGSQAEDAGVIGRLFAGVSSEWQDTATRLALVAHDIPDETLRTAYYTAAGAYVAGKIGSAAIKKLRDAA